MGFICNYSVFCEKYTNIHIFPSFALSLHEAVGLPGPVMGTHLPGVVSGRGSVGTSGSSTSSCNRTHNTHISTTYHRTPGVHCCRRLYVYKWQQGGGLHCCAAIYMHFALTWRPPAPWLGCHLAVPSHCLSNPELVRWVPVHDCYTRR